MMNAGVDTTGLSVIRVSALFALRVFKTPYSVNRHANQSILRIQFSFNRVLNVVSRELNREIVLIDNPSRNRRTTSFVSTRVFEECTARQRPTGLSYLKDFTKLQHPWLPAPSSRNRIPNLNGQGGRTNRAALISCTARGTVRIHDLPR